jgi:nucleotidyltransferase substrate binding protein (TIGR01987 family)
MEYFNVILRIGRMNADEKILNEVCRIAGKYPEIKKIMLFGSRARGDCHERSDYDLAVFSVGKNPVQILSFQNELDEMDTIYKFDVVAVNDDTDFELMENILREGVVLVDKSTKIENYLRAVERLGEALEECGENPSALIRDGAIQRFEFAAELAWKACREFLIDQGFAELNSPKAVMRQAFEFGMISDGNGWIYILNDRNLTSHIYDEKSAKEIFQRIKELHMSLFLALKNYFEAKN